MNKAVYWFDEEPRNVVKHLQTVSQGWDQWSSNPFMQAWVRNVVSYYSAVLEPSTWDTALTYTGDQGELVRMVVPQARSLIRQFVTLITKQRLAFQCVAETTGSDVIRETRLGNGLVNQVVDTERLDGKAERMAELACVLGTAYLKTTWRSDRGEPRVVNEGQVLYDGDVEISVLTPFDVYFDYTVEEWTDLDWVIVRTIKNRWSLIAQHPDLADEIRALPKARDWSTASRPILQQNTIADEDAVFVFEAYHKPTPALPQGRMLMYSDDRTIYFDGANRYMTIPVEICKPEPVMGYTFGYPKFSDLMPSQEMLDHSFSAIATNQAAFAVQNVTIPRGSGISVQEIGGMNFISFTPQNVQGGGRPEPLQLTQSSPETFKFIDLMRSHMLELSGINSALRGQPPPGVTSGAAIATLTTNALEFITSFSKAYNSCLERTLEHAINAYQKFAEVPKLVRMVGRNFQTFAEEFKGSDLTPIRGVKLTISNPLMQTVAGRTDMAERMIKMGAVKDGQQLVSILNGDDPMSLWKTELSENDLIQGENEALQSGEPVMALSTDDHARHIREHAGLLNDPAVRMKNERAGAILDHMLEHVRLSRETDPYLMAMVRTGKAPEMMAPGAAGPPPGAAGPGGPPPIPGGEAPMPTSKPAKPADDMLERTA